MLAVAGADRGRVAQEAPNPGERLVTVEQNASGAAENGDPSVNESVSNSVVLPPSHSILTIISGPSPCTGPVGPAAARRR